MLSRTALLYMDSLTETSSRIRQLWQVSKIWSQCPHSWYKNCPQFYRPDQLKNKTVALFIYQFGQVYYPDSSYICLILSKNNLVPWLHSSCKIFFSQTQFQAILDTKSTLSLLYHISYTRPDYDLIVISRCALLSTYIIP